MPVELALLGIKVLASTASARGGGDSPFFTRLLTLRCGVGCSSPTSGGSWGASSSTRVPITRTMETPRVITSFLRLTLSGVLKLLLFRFLVFLGRAALYMAFIFRMPIFPAISVRYRAAEMVLVLYVLIIFGFLCALQLEHALSSPITVGRMAGSTLIVRRTTVEKNTGPFTLGGGSLSHMFQLPTTGLPRVRVGMG